MLNIYVNPLTILKVIGVPVAKIALIPLPIKIVATTITAGIIIYANRNKVKNFFNKLKYGY